MGEFRHTEKERGPTLFLARNKDALFSFPKTNGHQIIGRGKNSQRQGGPMKKKEMLAIGHDWKYSKHAERTGRHIFFILTYSLLRQHPETRSLCVFFVRFGRSNSCPMNAGQTNLKEKSQCMAHSAGADRARGSTSPKKKEKRQATIYLFAAEKEKDSCWLDHSPQSLKGGKVKS